MEISQISYKLGRVGDENDLAFKADTIKYILEILNFSF